MLSNFFNHCHWSKGKCVNACCMLLAGMTDSCNISFSNVPAICCYQDPLLDFKGESFRFWSFINPSVFM